MDKSGVLKSQSLTCHRSQCRRDSKAGLCLLRFMTFVWELRRAKVSDPGGYSCSAPTRPGPLSPVSVGGVHLWCASLLCRHGPGLLPSCPPSLLPTWTLRPGGWKRRVSFSEGQTRGEVESPTPSGPRLGQVLWSRPGGGSTSHRFAGTPRVHDRRVWNFSRRTWDRN